MHAHHLARLSCIIIVWSVHSSAKFTMLPINNIMHIMLLSYLCACDNVLCQYLQHPNYHEDSHENQFSKSGSKVICRCHLIVCHILVKFYIFNINVTKSNIEVYNSVWLEYHVHVIRYRSDHVEFFKNPYYALSHKFWFPSFGFRMSV